VHQRVKLIVLLAIGAFAESSAAETRTWRDATGKFEIQAEFVQAKSGWVQLKKADGALLPLRIEKLSLLDQAHIARLQSEEGEPEAAEAEKPRVGRFQAVFEEHSPLASLQQVVPRMLSPNDARGFLGKLSERIDLASGPAYTYDLKAESFEVYVPEDYDPNIPYGLFVFINSADTGATPEGWLPVLKKRRLIIAGANNTGNQKNQVTRRIPLAIEAVFNISKQYNVDPTRVYISGNSGGGRAASWCAMAYADVFTGGQYHVGADHFRTYSLPKGGIMPASIHIPSQQFLEKSKQQNRYAFITGAKDFNRPEMKAVAQSMQKEGFRFVTYLEDPAAKHGPPAAAWFEKGLIALDAPLAAEAATAFDRAETAAERGQVSAALASYAQAAAHGWEQPFQEEARQHAVKLHKQMQEYSADISQLIKMGESRAAGKELAVFRKIWGTAGKTLADQLATEMREKRD
jgi:hypothetical protein